MACDSRRCLHALHKKARPKGDVFSTNCAWKVSNWSAMEQKKSTVNIVTGRIVPGNRMASLLPEDGDDWMPCETARIVAEAWLVQAALECLGDSTSRPKNKPRS